MTSLGEPVGARLCLLEDRGGLVGVDGGKLGKESRDVLRVVGPSPSLDERVRLRLVALADRVVRLGLHRGKGVE